MNLSLSSLTSRVYEHFVPDSAGSEESSYIAGTQSMWTLHSTKDASSCWLATQCRYSFTLKHINLDEDCLSEGRNKLKSWARCILRSWDSSRALMWHFMTAHYCSDSCSRSALTSTLKEARRCRSNHGIIWLFVGNNNAKVQTALYVTSHCRNQHRRRFYAILSPRCPISLKGRVSSLWLCSLITTDKDYSSYESWQMYHTSCPSQLRFH